MESKKVEFEVKICKDPSELSQADQELLKAAHMARLNAYAPYSEFKVGAAILLENGVTVSGNNQENASYPSGLCAERVAAFAAGANYPGVAIQTLAVVTAPIKSGNIEDAPAAPCGNCRQALYEYEQKSNSPIRVLMQSENGKVFIVNSISDLLPLGFDSSFL